MCTPFFSPSLVHLPSLFLPLCIAFFFLQLFNDLDVGFLPGNFFAENWIWEEAAAKNPILNRNKWIRVWLAGWLTALHTLHLRLLTDCVRSVIASWVLTHYWKWLKWNMFIYIRAHTLHKCTHNINDIVITMNTYQCVSMVAERRKKNATTAVAPTAVAVKLAAYKSLIFICINTTNGISHSQLWIVDLLPTLSSQ